MSSNRATIYGIKSKAAIALQGKLNGKLIAALLFIPYSNEVVLFEDIAGGFLRNFHRLYRIHQELSYQKAESYVKF